MGSVTFTENTCSALITDIQSSSEIQSTHFEAKLHTFPGGQSKSARHSTHLPREQINFARQSLETQHSPFREQNKVAE
jgi:hypothetical protein